MATAREQKSPVEKEGLETVGKFRDERFVRKPPVKPYDRPLTTLRTSGNNSWILKLVDPAQRLISSGSRMLFSSVIRNFPHHLTSRVSSQESSQSRKDDKKANVNDPFEVKVVTNEGDNRSRSSDQCLMMELEKTLKQKTFTRSEIDHLTTLLHSRNVDLPVVNEEKRLKFISSIPESNRKEFVKIPNSEVRMGRPLISTPILSSSVLDEDISSPAEIARAYMGSKQPKVCPSMQSLRAQGLGENSAGPTSILFSSKSNDMLLAPSSTSQGLKRRSSFFDKHIGPVVPLRRTRQKPNIHLSKGLSLPVSARPISVPEDGLNFDASQSSKFGRFQNFPSSIWNSQLPLKPKKTFGRKFTMNVENHNIPVAVGGHLRNVKDVDLPRNEEFVHDDKQSNSLHGISYQENRENTFQNGEKLEKLKSSDPHPSCALLKDTGSIGSCKDCMNDLGVPASAVVKSTIRPLKDKRAFPMSPDKDSVDQDESSADKVAPATAEAREGDISLAVRQTTANEALAPAKPQTTSQVIMGSSLNRSSDLKTSDDSFDDDIDARLTFQNASLCTLQPETIDSFGNKDLPENKQIDSSVFSFVNNASPLKQPNASSTAFDVGNKDDSLTESCAASANGDEPSYPYTQCNLASSNHKLDCSWRTCNDAFSSSASISAGPAFSFSSTPSYQSLNSGLSISCPSLFSSYSPSTGFMSQSSSRNIFLSATCASNNANITATLPSSFVPSTSGIGSYEDKIKQDASLHNVNDTYFSCITTPANSHYSMFSFNSAAIPSFVTNLLRAPTVSCATELSAEEVSAVKEFTANSEKTSVILGSPMSHVSSGMAGCSSPASELFNSGSRPSEFPITGFTSAPETSTIGKSNLSTSGTRLGFESFTGASFSSLNSTTSAAALAGSSSEPVMSNSHPKVAFRVSLGNNDCEEQGISKDNVPLFSQKPIPPPSSGFSFGPGSAGTSELNPFQVGKQQTLAEPQNSYPYIASSSSLEAKAEGSFSLNAGSSDKSKRRFVKVKRKK
ncbi:nuclear pore complex protein NUP1-like isoform X2 [Benincasa hispida]|uniref:nuclear pore complex protein NUP1-like isoform X2 n=1 Tax=Benincasa hispida TaxID=102211 RepID=UPI00190001B0|nr:nuclear pore complex protein NUP1-like isoform X2 [Benincasa hispida]